MNEHSEQFEYIKECYIKGFYKKKALKNLVIKGFITAEEYEEIVGEPYE